MAERKRVGLIFSNNENWIGGTYYILNLINALNALEDTLKPELIIFLEKPNDQKIVEEIGYPYLKFLTFSLNYTLPERIINKISRTILGKKIIDRGFPSTVAQIIFPYFDAEALYNIRAKLYWIPDFQAHIYPTFFTESELKRLLPLHQTLANRNFPIVLSSQDAANTFQKLFPESKSKIFVLNFAVTLPDFKHLAIEDLRKKYQLNQPYFIAPNQFWQHKNHLTVLKAIEYLSTQNLDFQLVFTGKEYDNRNPQYTDDLKEFVKVKNLSDKVKFLGFIDRKEQLQLMNNALAVIQPSLFEGWSTVVEDAKAMNQAILLSNLPVHQEQKNANCYFFSPQNHFELAALITQFLQSKPELQVFDYQDNVRTFGLRFLEVAEKMTT
jgi:glycosyltransferase involved in cell wall biosynthesis